MVGISGSGKSYFAEHFASSFKSPIVSYGDIQKILFDNQLDNKDDHNKITNIANYVFEEMLKTGHTVVYDGESYTNADRLRISKTAKQYGYEPLFVWVQTDQITAKKRYIKQYKSNPSFRPDSFDETLMKFSAPNISKNTVVISGKHTYASQLKIVLKRLIDPVKPATKLPGIRSQVNSRSILIR